MRTAVVTIAHGRHEHWRQQRAALARSRAVVDDQVLVAIDDRGYADDERGTALPAARVIEIGTHPDGLPLAQARNVGARAALDAGADLLVFLDVDCLPAPDLMGAYLHAATARVSRGSLLCGPVTYLSPAPIGGYDLERLHEYDAPHRGRPAPQPDQTVVGGAYELFWSLSFAVDASTWSRIGGFHEDYVGYGGEDTDFGQRARQAAVDIAWVGGARAYHQHHPVEDPPVRHIDAILRNGAVFAARWGWWPMQGWLDDFVRAGMVERTPTGGYRRIARASDASASGACTGARR